MKENIEEDIEILEKDISYNKKQMEEIGSYIPFDIKLMKRVENLLKAYKEDKEKISSLCYELGKYMAKSKEDEAVIEEMAEYLSIVRDCPNGDKGANLDCENRCSDDDNLYSECWKQYFRNKVKEKNFNIVGF